MTNCPPPYRPLRGADPPHFVDRADERDLVPGAIVASSTAAYQAGPGDPRFHRLVVSEPAMGKTAMLRAIGRETADRLGWAVAIHCCRPKERALGAVASETLASIQGQWPTEVRKLSTDARAFVRERPTPWPPGVPDGSYAPAESAGPRVDGREHWAGLKHFFKSAGSLARALSRGILVVLDDADRLAGGEVESIGHLARSLSRDELPVALLLSGGPQLEEHFARVANFSSCVWPTRLGWFDNSEAREALVVPAADRGVEFHEEALELLCLSADGYPLELQRLGFAAWSAAGGAEVIAVDDVHAALALLSVETAARAS
jgi:hypothetical protein